MPSICIIPKASNTGGVTSFQASMERGLNAREVQVSHDLSGGTYDAVLLTGGVRDLGGLLKAKRRGVPIVQRLDGINWLHRHVSTGPRHFLRAEYGNRLLALLRRYFVSRIVYQSEFVRSWWGQRFGPDHTPAVVIHNGVDLTTFSDQGPEERSPDRIRLLLVEGSLQGGYETGLETAVSLATLLAEKFSLELMVVGRVPVATQSAYSNKSRLPICWKGLVPHDQIPSIDRSAHLFYSSDINAACPNSVIEAMACGLPVVAFATGALPELVLGEAGRLAPYGGDPWKLEPPDLHALAEAAAEVMKDQPHFRQGARRRAEEAFGLDKMVDNYLEVLLG